MKPFVKRNGNGYMSRVAIMAEIVMAATECFATLYPNFVKRSRMRCLISRSGGSVVLMETSLIRYATLCRAHQFIQSLTLEMDRGGTKS